MSNELWNYQRLSQIVKDKTQERFDLEFKPCSELRWGSGTFDRETGQPRARDAVLDELSRDVSAMANSAGGVIIYGIEENHKTSTAKNLDENPFTNQKNEARSPEWLDSVIRAHIFPSPDVRITPVFKNDDKAEGWYYVVEVQQSVTTHQARDKRFYRRHNTTRSMMEHHEIVDVMNRTKGPVIETQWKFEYLGNRAISLKNVESTLKKNKDILRVSLELTSVNYISADYGTLRIFVLAPLKIDGYTGVSREKGGIRVGQSEDQAHVEIISYNWSVHQGQGVYPGHWNNFGNFITLAIPLPKGRELDPFYLLKTEINGPNAPVRTRWHPILPYAHDEFPWTIDTRMQLDDYSIERFWQSYHSGLAFWS